MVWVCGKFVPRASIDGANIRIDRSSEDPVGLFALLSYQSSMLTTSQAVPPMEGIGPGDQPRQRRVDQMDSFRMTMTILLLPNINSRHTHFPWHANKRLFATKSAIVTSSDCS